jgi:thiol:disulfide interchange protein DsbC
MTTLFRSVAAFALISMGIAYAAFGQSDTSEEPWAAELRTKLTQTLVAATESDVQVVRISETVLAGLVEVELSTGETLFSDREGGYLVTGDLFKASPDGLENLSAATRQGKVAEWIAAVPESEMIIFTPEERKASITVFTDVDCTFCRKLHGELDAILALGIQVRYMAYPRGGEASTAYPKMISVWCSDDRNKSLTQAKNGQNLPTRDCETPVLEHYNLGNKIGISGTPALVLEDGTVIPGYLDSQQLAGVVFGQ